MSALKYFRMAIQHYTHELCCVAHSYLDIKVVCLLFVRRLPALHYIVYLFFAFRTGYYALGYQVITDI